MRAAGRCRKDEHQTRPAGFEGSGHTVPGDGTVVQADADGGNSQPR
jgi:hypothetical protein